MDISIVALIASIVSICLAFFAIWQANHHRDKSDKLNRDTTQKLSRIEAFATSTKEDAFAEIKRWGDFARAGGKASEEAEKAKDEEMKKLKEEIEGTTSAEINKLLQTVEGKLTSSAEASAVVEIRREFEELKKEMGKIQDRAVTEAEDVQSRRSILGLLGLLSVEEKAVLKEIARQGEASVRLDDLADKGYDRRDVLKAVIRAVGWGLAEDFNVTDKDGNLWAAVRLDGDLRRTLES